MVSAFVPTSAGPLKASSFVSSVSVRRAPAPAARASITMADKVLPVFTEAIANFKTEFPAFANRGWGCTVKAERWNGRHAMFGMLAIFLTAYAKGHGMIPDATTPLDLSSWGTLAALGNYTPITNERAIILIAHVHVLLVSVAAAIAPFSFQDKLLLEPGEADEAPAGLFPDFTPGLTKDAELWNGRVAMLGVMSLVGCSMASGKDILDCMNIGLGGILY
mmetsp:Transcript_3327/g.7990  ORF Transcript_3327/g.7990 Transcript_3327/m.7990 type:complete len:220 (-) Transcript_3327:107-766(-)